ADAINKIRSVPAVFSSGGAVDGLISRIEKESIGSFQELVKSGVDGADDVIPILQTVVVLSDGGDSSGAGFAGGQTAQVLHEKLAKGEGMSEFTRLPIPVVSLWFPDPKLAGGLGNFDEVKANNAFEWMSQLATTEVGGYFDIIQQGEVGKGAKIARVIRNRFDNMYYLQAKAACLDSSGEQTFTIGFTDTKSKILPDKWTKIGVAYNFAKWVLSVDKKKTEEAAKLKPLQPGETFEVYGDFCWGSNQGDAEAFFLTEADAPEVKKATSDKTGAKGKALLQSLSAKGQKAETVSVTPLVAKFRVPNTPALFPDNKGDKFNLNLVVFDNKQKRVSTLDQKGVFAMSAQKAPVNKLLIVGAIGGGVVLILLIAILARSGGGGNGRSKKRRGGAPPPGPMPGQPPGSRTDDPQPSHFGAGPEPQVAVIGAAAGFPAPQYRPVAAVVPPLPPMAPVGLQPMQAPAQQTYVVPDPIVQTAFAPMPMQAAPVARTEFVAPPQQQAAPQLAPSQAMQATAMAAPTPPPPNYGPSNADVTIPPQAGSPMFPHPAPQGLHAQNKGATSFPTTCPNPACRKQVLIPPGGTAQCAFCGTLVDASGVAAAPIPAAGGFGLTGHVSPEAADAAARNAPKAAGSTAMLQSGEQGAPAIVAATLVGTAGNFRILPGIESRAGRDGTLCSIALTEVRVSGVHATLKLERGTLLVRDDRSHNGTFVNGNRIPPGSWTPVPGGSQLRFGPVEFTVRHEF
ncbi:MAG: FHA domain-containing protein, partial [Polyangiales bacterium]